MKIFLKLVLILISFIIYSILFASSTFASELKINTTGIYIAGASESLNNAKKHALEDAMRQAAEQAGVLVNSYTKTHNMVLTEDEVTIVATKIVKIIDKKFQVDLISDSEIKVIVYIDAVVNTDSISEDILSLKKENKKLQEEKSSIKRKQNILERLHVLSESIRNEYREKFNFFEMPKKRNELMPDSNYNVALENYFIDMIAGEYKGATTDIIIAATHYKKQKNIDKSVWYYYLDNVICDFQLKRIEAYIARNDYLIAMIECAYFNDAIEKNHYYELIDKTIYQKLDNYTVLLKDYFDVYEPDKWEIILKSRGSGRLG